MVNLDARSTFTYFLWLTALHSCFTGIFLIFLPAEYLTFFGFPEYPDTFFQAQGGIFHIIMTVAYLMASFQPAKSKNLIYFIITVKFIAAVFLFTYFFIIAYIWMVLLSGIVDGIMAIGILILYNKYKKLNN